MNLLEQLRTENAAFDEAARGWTEADRQAKKQLRQRRQATFLQITIALVRLGEIDFALRLPKLPFARRIEDLDRVVGQPRGRRPTATGRGMADSGRSLRPRDSSKGDKRDMGE